MKKEQLEILKLLREKEFVNYVNKLSVDSIMVFGSVITDKFTEESDIDIAVLGKSKFSLTEILRFESFLEDLLGRNIDVIDLQSDNLDIFIKIDILNNGRIIYSTDDNKNLEDLKEKIEWYYRENEHYFECRKRDLLSWIEKDCLR